MIAKRSVLLTAAPATPPTAFRLFRAGANPSSKGLFQFGPAEAAAVMAAWRTEGQHRLPIDVEHSSLDPAAMAARSNAGDAVGWFTPELRNGGELWASQVEWGPAGLERLAKKSQSYFSPAFSADGEGRVTALVNVALVAMPALHALDQLVAAGKFGAKSSTTLRARVTNETAAVFCGLAKQAGVAPGVLLRRLLVSLASDPAGTANAGLDTIRSALGLEPDAGRQEIVDAIEALFTLIGGDPADAPPPDPMAAAASAPPVKASKLTDAQRAALKRRNLPETDAMFAALKKTMTRGAAPARAALSRAVDAPATPAVPRAFTAAEIAFGERHRIPRTDLRATLAERASKATRRAT